MGKFPRRKKGFECSECNEFYESKDEADACCPKDDSEEVDRWECVDCNELYEDREEAYHCCE